MKKTTILLLCLALLGGAGLYLLLRPSTVPGQYARHLPPETIGTVNLTSLSTFADGFAASPLGRALVKETVHAIVRELGGTAKAMADYDRLHDSVVGVAGDPAFRALFGEDTTLALLPPEPKAWSSKPAEALRQSLVVVARTSAAGAVEPLGRLLGNARVSRETVDGLELIKLSTNDNQVLYGYSEGATLLLAFAPAPITRCVAASKSGSALDKAPLFQQATAFWQGVPEATTFSRLYCNLARAAELLAQATDPELREAGAVLAGMETLFQVTHGTDQGLASRGRSSYRYEQLHPLMKSAVDAAGTNQTLHLLKEQTLAYNWASSLRPDVIVKAMAANDKEYRKLDTEVRGALGVSLEELGRAFGPQYGGVLDDIVRTPLFPWPKLTLFVELHDRKIAETVVTGLRRMIAASGLIGETQTQRAGRTIYSWPVLPGESAQPAMVLTDTMGYFSTSRQALEALLDDTPGSATLAAPVRESLGNEQGERLAAANFGGFVAFPQRMARPVAEALDWLGSILASVKQVSLTRLNREVVQLMQSVELLTATTQLNKERAEWTMTLRAAPVQPGNSIVR